MGFGRVSHSTVSLPPCPPARHAAQAGLLFPQVMIYAVDPSREEYQFRWVTVLNDRCMDGYCCLGSK